MKKLAILAIIIVPLLVMFFWAIGQYNTAETKVVRFEEVFRNRTAQLDKMKKVIKQKGIVVKQGDTSFLRVVDAIMNGRKDGENLGMKWIQEQNPGAQWTEVASMYKDLSRTIEAQRESFFETERQLSAIKGEHDLLLRKFPGKILFSMFGTEPIKYTPIASSDAQEVIRTGTDNDNSVF